MARKMRKKSCRKKKEECEENYNSMKSEKVKARRRDCEDGNGEKPGGKWEGQRRERICKTRRRRR